VSINLGVLLLTTELLVDPCRLDGIIILPLFLNIISADAKRFGAESGATFVKFTGENVGCECFD
jgi:hypothetical protein